MFAGIVYRLPLKDQPQSSDLQEIHRFSVDESDLTGCLPSRVPTCGPATNGMAIGESGRMYVAESGRNEIAVLSSDGVLLRTISNPLFDYPGYLAFRGDKLLVTNNDGFDPVDRPERWAVLSVDVGDTGVPPFQPTNIK